MGYKLCSAESAIATCDSYSWPHKNKTKQLQPRHQPNLRRFAYAELEAATNAFSSRNLLGKGSHGAVYRAVLDNGSHIVAVKRPNSSATLAAENEIQILPTINNRRIVNLVGYANSETHPGKLLLVVDHMPNGSLYDLLHSHSPSQKPPPMWSTRLRIALQVSKAVRSLHTSHPPVIHRDIKSSNVLLDGKFGARLSDFGLALSGHVEDVRVMSTPPAGTLGYLDPCYLAPCDVTTKCDVFSFGILLLEITSGRRAIDVNYSPPAIIEWALPLVKTGDYQGICDRRMGCVLDRTVAKELGVLVARCVRSTAEKRPSMSEVVTCLERVYKRVKLMQAVPMWTSLRRRVEKCQPLDENENTEEEPRVKTWRHGNRRSLSRKVSNVPTLEDRLAVEEVTTRVEHRTGKLKSKSVGSCREIIKVGAGAGDDCEIIKVNDGNNQVVKVKVKVSNVVRLSKSRSMSVLPSSKMVIKHPQVKELDVLPLLVKSSSCKSPMIKS